jgi:DNA-binding PadR family transcriptional regulator
MRAHCSHVVLENFFEPCILFLLSDKASYGYELTKNLKGKCGCSVNVGNLYRGLGRLVKSGDVKKRSVKSDIGPNRVMYEITPKGKLLLADWIVGLKEQNKLISKLITNYKNKYDSSNK